MVDGGCEGVIMRDGEGIGVHGVKRLVRGMEWEAKSSLPHVSGAHTRHPLT